jgi:sirohydrochlorin ferrochelatase
MLMVAVGSGIVIFAHGSSVPSANDAVRVVAEKVAATGGFDLVETAFLEAQPDLSEAIERLVERGATRVLVIPYFLTLGIHLQRDLPAIINKITDLHHGVEIRVTPPLDEHAALVEIVLDRAREGLRKQT